METIVKVLLDSGAQKRQIYWEILWKISPIISCRILVVIDDNSTANNRCSKVTEQFRLAGFGKTVVDRKIL